MKLRSHDTRWVYHQERTVLARNAAAVKVRSMADLRAQAVDVWAAEAPGGRTLPSVTAHRGTPYLGQLYSYCEGYTVIKLARHQRTRLVLLHELTHALGPSTHGESFVRRYFPLLWRHAGYDRRALTALAAQRGYKL